MKILVTGGAGFIGSVLVEELLNDGHEVIAYDNLMYKQHSLLQFCHNKNFKFVCGDVRDEQNLKKYIIEADIVFPLAALVGVGACNKDKQGAVDINLGQIAFICDNKSKNQRVIMPMTNSGYGTGEGTSFCTEESELKPLSHYGHTKCDAEKYLLLFENTVSLRLATVFGVCNRPRLDLLVNDFVFKSLSDGYLVLFEKDFKRNYIHIRDVVSAMKLMMTPQPYNVFNVGLSDANLSKIELALKIKNFLPNLVIHCEEFHRDPDQRNYLVSNLRLESLGWRPQYSLDDGIKELIQAFPMLNHNKFKNV